MVSMAPKLDGGIGYEQPVNPGAGGLGAAASIAGMFAKGFSEPRTPTADERNAEYWSAWTEAQGLPGLTLGQATAGQLRAFSSFKPESADWAFKGAETQRSPALAELDLDMEIADQNRKAFLISPEGQLAQHRASSASDPESAQNILNISFGEFLTKQATLEEIKFQTAQTGWTNERRKEILEVNKTGLQDQANVLAKVVYDSLDVLALDPSATMELPEGLLALVPGLPRTMNKDNAVRVAQQLRSSFMTTMISRIESDMGLDRGSLGGMDETTEKFVFGGLDAAITMLENGVKPEEIKKRMESNATQVMIKAGVPMEYVSSIALAAGASTSLQQAVIAQLTGDMQAFLDSGAIEDARRIALEMSEKERSEAFAGFSELAKIYAGTSTVGQVYDNIDQTTKYVEGGKALIAAVSAAEASGALLGDGFWEGNIAASATQLDGISRADPTFAPEMTNHLTGDMNTRVVRVNEKIRGYKLAVDGSGKFSVIPDEATEREIAGYEQDIANLQSGAFVPVGGKEAVAGLIAGYTKEIRDLRNPDLGEVSADINAIQKRWAILGQTGEIGQAVRTRLDADFQLSEAPKIAEEARAVLEESVKPGEVKTDTLQPAPAGTEAVSVAGVSVTVNLGMKPILSGYEGTSKMVLEGADVHMEELIAGPFATLQTAFGKDLVINDAIAKDGTSRETQTPNSRHFHGDAIDISTAGMSDADKLRLVDLAIEAGFQGFGFGENILHIDLGHRRSWAYGNDTFGGKPVSELQALVNGSSVPRPVSEGGPKLSGEATAGDESDPGEGPVTNFSLPKTSSAAPSISSVAPEQPITPAVEAGVFTRTPGGQGENQRQDRTGGEDTRPQGAVGADSSPEVERLVESVGGSVDAGVKSGRLDSADVENAIDSFNSEVESGRWDAGKMGLSEHAGKRATAENTIFAGDLNSLNEGMASGKYKAGDIVMIYNPNGFYYVSMVRPYDVQYAKEHYGRGK